MRKETLLAISIGLILGLAITFVVYRATQFDDNKAVSDTILDLDSNNTKENDSKESEDLIIFDPIDQSVQTQSEVLVRGSSDLDAHIVILAGEKSYILDTDDNGDFSVQVKLQNGANVITITSLSSDGQETTTYRTVTVSDTLEKRSSSLQDLE